MLPTTDQYETPCTKSQDQKMWFSNRGPDVAKCKILCNTCLIKTACLASAIEYERMSSTEMTGTQGGLSRAERRKIISMKRIA